jgi:hypothetical protein
VGQRAYTADGGCEKFHNREGVFVYFKRDAQKWHLREILHIHVMQKSTRTKTLKNAKSAPPFLLMAPPFLLNRSKKTRFCLAHLDI